MKTVISFCLALFLACCLLMNGLLKANRTIKAKEQEIKTQAETIKQKRSRPEALPPAQPCHASAARQADHLNGRPK